MSDTFISLLFSCTLTLLFHNLLLKDTYDLQKLSLMFSPNPIPQYILCVWSSCSQTSLQIPWEEGVLNKKAHI